MKKLRWVLAAVIVVGLLWYLFVKPYDYLVTFKAKTIPGTLNQTIKIWSNALGNAEILQATELHEITQQLQFGDSTHVYQWKITSLNDSLSEIKVYARDSNHSFKNKLKIPFFDTPFEKRTRATLLDFNAKLKEHLSKIKVTLVGKEAFPKKYCAYTQIKRTQFGKADGMMGGVALLDDVLLSNEITLAGHPFIEVVEWDMETDSLLYNFCYPIIPKDSLPEHPEIDYKTIPETRALKALYNGNYITSDRAWYALLRAAKTQGIEVTGLPLEVFYSNPNMGSDEENWKAEVFMPIKGNKQ